MSRCKAILLVLAAALVGAAILLYFEGATHDVAVDHDVYNQLRLGMTAEEVHAVIALAPGDYTGAYCHITWPPEREGELIGVVPHDLRDGTSTAVHPRTRLTVNGLWWRGQIAMLMVFFDEQNRVIERRYYPAKSQSWSRFQFSRITGW